MSKFTYNLNEAEQDQEAVPNGVYQLAIKVKPFNASTVLRPAKNGFTKMLELELTVVGGDYNGRKFSDLLTLEFDEQSYAENGPCGQQAQQSQAENYRKAESIGRKRLRSILESAHEISPKDDSDDAKQKRLVPGGDFLVLNGLDFWAKVDVRANDGFRPRNVVSYCLTPASYEWPQRPITTKSGGRQSRVPVPLAAELDDQVPF